MFVLWGLECACLLSFSIIKLINRASLFIGLSSKESTCNAGNASLIPGLGRSPGEGSGNLLQYSCLGNPMDRAPWWATVMRSQRVRHDLATQQQQQPYYQQMDKANTNTKTDMSVSIKTKLPPN